MLEAMLTTGRNKSDVVGQIQWVAPGTYDWIVPDDVTEVCVLVVGAGQSGWVRGTNGYGGVGGVSRWKNKVSVTPGSIVRVVVGNAGPWSTMSVNDLEVTIWPASSLTSTVLGITAGYGAVGDTLGYSGTIAMPTTSAPLYIGGGNAGSYVATNTKILNFGASVGSLSTRSGANADVAPRRGINITTGQWVTSGAVNYCGQMTGGGGSSIPKAANGGANNQIWSGGHGGVRIIWGKNRWYPDRNIHNVS